MKIRSHYYVEQAFTLVNNVKNEPFVKEYRALALRFPTMIMQSGLYQSIGFLIAKGKDEHGTLLKHIEVLLELSIDLRNGLPEADISEYQRLTRKALAATAWLKRYSQALLGDVIQ